VSALPQVPLRARLSVARASMVGAGALLVASWSYLVVEGGGRADLLDPDTWHRAADFVRALLGQASPLAPDPPPRPFGDLAEWRTMLGLAVDTLAMSVAAIWIAVLGMLVTVMAGARPRREERAGALRMDAFGLVRVGWIVMRAVPELVWALLLVLVLPPGVLTGALALGLHNLGIVGRLCAEVVENLDPGPRRALRGAGASGGQALAYAVLPQALPLFLTYALYRWEVIIRTTIVVGFVSAGGLGREFRLAMSFFHYTDVAMILVTYFGLVVFVDLVATLLRRLAR